jgi:xanthine dehydrogenase accessory factor
MSTREMAARIAELTDAQVPFVRATVVRAQEPSSAKTGDEAIVHADGSVEGFVGGHCAEGSVRAAALGLLGSGETLLLRVLPDGDSTFPDSPGASVVVNPCLSGGALEIFLEPLLPSPVLLIVGTSPTAQALAALAPTVGFVVRRDVEADAAGATAVVISSHGGDELGAIRTALAAGVGFIGLVCSKTRGRSVLDELAQGDRRLSDSDLARIHIHVGLDIGAKTAPEIGLSILAAIVRAIRRDGLTASTPAEESLIPAEESLVPAEESLGLAEESLVIDPVCGMSVNVGPDTPHAVVGGVDYWFCNPGCRDRYVASHAR